MRMAATAALIAFFGLTAIPLSGQAAPTAPAAPTEVTTAAPELTLVRGGWTGELSVSETVGPVMTALAWTAVGVFAVRRWFRWEPRH